MNCHTRRIFCNFFFFLFFPRYFQRVCNISLFFFSFGINRGSNSKNKISPKQRTPDRFYIFHKITKIEFDENFHAWKWSLLQKRFAKKGRGKNSSILYPCENYKKFDNFREGQSSGTGWNRPVGSLRGKGGWIQFSPRSHENSRNLLDPTCVPRPWAGGSASSLVRRTV